MKEGVLESDREKEREGDTRREKERKEEGRHI